MTGIVATDTGRDVDGLRRATTSSEALAEIVSGSTTHGGALLAPLGVRFVVAQEGDLPACDRGRASDAQVDLDREGASGLLIYRNARTVPPAGRVFPTMMTSSAIVASSELGAIEQLPSFRRSRWIRGYRAGGRGSRQRPGTVVVSTEFVPEWRARSAGEADDRSDPREAFGWSTAFDAPGGRAPGPVRRSNGCVPSRRSVLGLLWLAALWITRKPVSR